MIFILGVDHWLQEYNLVAPGEYLSGEPPKEELEYRLASKRRFYELVEALVEEHDIEIIGEECKVNQDTIPRRLAGEVGAGYIEIDMHKDERAAAGITEDYQASPQSEKDGFALREKHMAEKLGAALPEGGNALVVCGANHVDGLAKLFRDDGRKVESQDISKETWAENPINRTYRLGFLKK